MDSIIIRKVKIMKNFTIYGNPVIHSKSPQMHNAGFRHIHIESNYNKTLIEEGKDLKTNFIQNNIKGANITVPHKEVAFKEADEVIGLAKKIGAVNTYINNDGKVTAYNTDAPGFMKAIEEFGKIKHAIILGAGGTAKAIAVAFNEAGIKTTVLNRSKNDCVFMMNDKLAAAHGLESRTPFLDHRIAELAFQIPPELKIKGQTTKYILREAVKGLVPEKVRLRLDKKGLVTPVYKWLNDGLYSWKEEKVQQLKTRDIAFKKEQESRGEFDRTDYISLCLELWFENMFSKIPQSTD